MNRKSSTVLIGSFVIGIVIMLAIYMGLIVTGVIDTRPSTLVVTTDSAQKEFDGTPLVCEQYAIKKGVLKKGHKLEVTYGAQQTDVGWIENTATVKVKDALGADVTSHYNLETLPGKLTVTPRKLMVKSGDTQKMYDGYPLTYEMWDLVLGSLPEGYTASAFFSGMQITPGSSENSFGIIIYDPQGRSVQRNFDITYRYGELTVTKRPITIISSGATKIYDGQPLIYESYIVEGEVFEEHYLDIDFTQSITNVGEVDNIFLVRVQSLYTGYVEDVTDFYEISRIMGKLKVQPRPIEISVITPCVKNFKGGDLPQGRAEITKGSLVYGHEFEVTVEPRLNDQNTVEFILSNPKVYDYSMGKAVRAGYLEGYDVTGNYAITLVHGVDRENLIPLTVLSGSAHAQYTGQPLTCERFTKMGELEPGHLIVPIYTGSQTEIGISDNTFTVAVIDTATGEDVTYRYDVIYQYGTLEVYADAPTTGGEISDDGGLDNNVQNADATAARIYAEKSGRVYLRWKSYGAYSFREDAGNWGWGDAVAYPLASSNMLYTVGQALDKGGKQPILYEIELMGGQYLIPNYAAEGPEGAYNDVVLSPLVSAYSVQGYSWEYSFADALRYAAADFGDEQMEAYYQFVKEQYLDVPESTKQALLAYAEHHGLRADPLTVIDGVASLIRSAAIYDMDYPACPAGEDEVIWFLTESKSGVCRHFASAATLLYRSLGIPARYVVGYSTYAAGGEWTEVKGADAHAWVEVYIVELGWVRIDPTPAAGSTAEGTLVFAPGKIVGYYTGEAYTIKPENVFMTQGALEQGHYVDEIVVSGSRTEAGTGVSTIEKIVIRDQNGADVTAQYRIVKQKGVIEVRKPTLTISASSSKKVYDGQPLRAPTFTYSFRNAKPGAAYQVTASVTGEQTEIGTGENIASGAVVLDEDGVDITQNFDVKYVDGTLKVYLYELTISTSGATKTYDGMPLTVPEIDFDAAPLTERGHVLEYTLPSITSVGAIYNTPTCRVIDSQGEDVTAAYDIRINAGVLRIESARITLQTNSAEKVYDGTPLQSDGYVLLAGQPVDGHRIVSYSTSGTQTNVGFCDVMITDIVIVNEQGHNVTANYQITILPGTLTVLAP